MNYVVVDKEKLESDLTIVADSIRAKSGTTEDLAFPLGMKEVVESIDTSKPEQEKTIDITENETTEVTPDEGKVLSKVTVNVDVVSGGGSSEEFVGIKLSGFTGPYNLPTVADVRDLILVNNDAWSYTENRFDSMFSNTNVNANSGMFVELKEVYLPDNIHSFSGNMFNCCSHLTDIHGDFTETVRVKGQAFRQCRELTKIPYLPSLSVVDANAFNTCTGLTSVNIYNTLTSFATTAFNSCTNLLDIYVPWAEGEVANAPWGATNATIHYNTTYDENHNPIV